MDMGRRSFFGAAAGAVVAGPSAAKAAVTKGSSNVATLGFHMDTSGLRNQLLELNEISSTIGRVRDIGFDRQGDRYVYRTGYPAIDALKSVSGVHRERMEKRMPI